MKLLRPLENRITQNECHQNKRQSVDLRNEIKRHHFWSDQVGRDETGRNLPFSFPAMTFYVAHRIAGTNFTSQSCILRQKIKASP